MTKIHKKHFNSWDELSKFIDDTFTFFNRFCFRGHADANWNLESTLTRAVNKKMLEKDVNKLVKEHIINFKQNLRGRSKLKLNKISENEVLAIGQHFGLYTPLLDLSESPYVALFFALQGHSNSGNRCLWAFSENFINDIKIALGENKNQFELVKPISHDNPRLVSQQGLFIRIPVEKAFEEVIKEVKSSSKGVQVFKIVFDDSIKNDSLASLNNMNINNLTLFPDFIGASNHANYILDIEEHLYKRRKEIWKNHDSN
ncbi:FRG domain-containing protein [Jejudonia soesokkakensis]|uniref:FRG domain-containing protein n=1 Tax=Jejudonia soesokkakensis TaxID=1323432 RepID=A0ABW2MS88_9FLAO